MTTPVTTRFSVYIKLALFKNVIHIYPKCGIMPLSSKLQSTKYLDFQKRNYTFPNGPVINQRGRKSYVFYQKNLWNCNVMKFETMREEKTISSLLPWGRKWFFPPSWFQISWHYNFTSFLSLKNPWNLGNLVLFLASF